MTPGQTADSPKIIMNHDAYTINVRSAEKNITKHTLMWPNNGILYL